MLGSAAQNVIALSDAVLLYHLGQAEFAALMRQRASAVCGDWVCRCFLHHHSGDWFFFFPGWPDHDCPQDGGRPLGGGWPYISLDGIV